MAHKNYVAQGLALLSCVVISVGALVGLTYWIFG